MHPGRRPTIVTTLLMVCSALVALAATLSARPVAGATVMLVMAHAGLLVVIAPAVIAVNCTGYGFGLVRVNVMSPSVAPG